MNSYFENKTIVEAYQIMHESEIAADDSAAKNLLEEIDNYRHMTAERIANLTALAEDSGLVTPASREAVSINIQKLEQGLASMLERVQELKLLCGQTAEK